MLGVFHEPSGIGLKRVFPPPAFADTFAAGMVAGGIQSLVSIPPEPQRCRKAMGGVVMSDVVIDLGRLIRVNRSWDENR